MIIRYPKKQIRSDLIVGALYLLTGILGIIFESDIFQYAFTGLGILYLGSGLYKMKFQYLQIENSLLTCFLPGRKKKIDLRQITRIKKFTDEIIFLTPRDELKINTSFIAKKDLPLLTEVLAALDIEPQKNPFNRLAKTH